MSNPIALAVHDALIVLASDHLMLPKWEGAHFTVSRLGEEPMGGAVSISETARFVELSITLTHYTTREHPIEWVAELANRLNAPVPFGTFVVSYETGEVVFRTSLSFGVDERPTITQMLRLWDGCTNAARLWKLAMGRRTKRECTPKEAIDFALDWMELRRGPQQSTGTKRAIVKRAFGSTTATLGRRNDGD
jgi:hypothetical protein